MIPEAGSSSGNRISCDGVMTAGSGWPGWRISIFSSQKEAGSPLWQLCLMASGLMGLITMTCESNGNEIFKNSRGAQSFVSSFLRSQGASTWLATYSWERLK